MKVFLVAGEASGDLHAGHVVSSLRKSWQSNPRSQSESLELVGWGGDRMQQAGMRLLSHYRDRAFMGLVEVIKNLKTVMGFLSQAKEDIVRENPDVLLLIDNPGFNLRLAEFAKARGIKVHYYIAPKAWAWNEGRIKSMRSSIDKLYGIFPFEEEYFGQRGMPCTYVGNPILEEINSSIERFHDQRGWDVDLGDWVQETDSKVILLMPGSRKNEVRSLLPIFIQSARLYDSHAVCVVAGAPGLEWNFYDSVLEEAIGKGELTKADKESVHVVFGATYHLLMQLGDGEMAHPVVSTLKGRGLALVASGTATLETALLGVPQVVAYRVNALTYWAAKWLVKLRWVSLVNILLRRGLLEEHLQQITNSTLVASLHAIDQQQSGSRYEELATGYRELRDLLQLPEGKSASMRVATEVLSDL